MTWHLWILTELPRLNPATVGWIRILSTHDFDRAADMARLYPFCEITSIGINGPIVFSYMTDNATRKEK